MGHVNILCPCEFWLHVLTLTIFPYTNSMLWWTAAVLRRLMLVVIFESLELSVCFTRLHLSIPLLITSPSKCWNPHFTTFLRLPLSFSHRPSLRIGSFVEPPWHSYIRLLSARSVTLQRETQNCFLIRRLTYSKPFPLLLTFTPSPLFSTFWVGMIGIAKRAEIELSLTETRSRFCFWCKICQSTETLGRVRAYMSCFS